MTRQVWLMWVCVCARITSAPIADVCVVWAKVVNEENKIRGFVLDRSMAGLTTPTIRGKLSLKASETGQIIMEDVRVPKENFLPKVHGTLTPSHAPLAWSSGALVRES